MLKRFLCLLSLCFVLLMTACAAGMGGYDYYNGEAALDENGEAYIEIDERGYQDPKNNPLSSFSLDSTYPSKTGLTLKNAFLPFSRVFSIS